MAGHGEAKKNGRRKRGMWRIKRSHCGCVYEIVNERGAGINIGGEGEGSRAVGAVKARRVEMGEWGMLLDHPLRRSKG